VTGDERASIVQHLWLDEKVDRLLDDVRGVKQHLSSVEVSVATMAILPRSPAASTGFKTGSTGFSTG